MVKSKNDLDKTARNMGLSVLVLAILLIGLFTFLYFRSKNSNSSSQTNNTTASQTQSSSTTLDAGWSNTQKVGLAKALTAKGVIFYGAYWCPHCKDQKAAFGDALQYVTYYECDPQGPSPKVDQCNAAGITGYPTWIYKGDKKEGAQTLGDLATWIGYKK
jgi:thiol-disulfide isomerase/thioredoxin